MTGEKCRHFSLLTWNSFIGQFVHPEGGYVIRVEGEVCFKLLLESGVRSKK